MKSAICLIGFALVLPAYGQVKKTPKGYLLQAKYKVGQVTKVVLAITSAEIKQSVRSTTRVLNVESDGSAKIQVLIPKQGTTLAQQDTIYVNKFGVPKDGKIGAFGAIYQWPDTPVKLGETWSGDINLGEGENAMPVKAAYKLVGFKKIGKVEVARISTVLNMKSPLTISGSGFINVRMDNGQVLSSDLKLAMLVPDQKQKGKTRSMPMTMTVTCQQ